MKTNLEIVRYCVSEFIHTIIFCLIVGAVIAIFTALFSCSTFTAPKDPVTGIRQDAPPEWQGTPNPLDSPAAPDTKPASEGNFGHEWLWR